MLPLNSCNNDPNKFYVANLSLRWGSQAFMTAIEYKFFNPNNADLNKLIDVWPVEFAGTLHFVVGVPMAYAEKVKQIALDMGLKVCEGTPTHIHDKQTVYFPLNGPNVWTLENQKRPFFHKIPYLSENQECEMIRHGQAPFPFNKARPYRFFGANGPAEMGSGLISDRS